VSLLKLTRSTKRFREANIGPADLQRAWDELSTAEEGDALDLVVLGCPHFSFDEFRTLADLLRTRLERGEKLPPGVRFVVISCQSSFALAQRSDFLEVLEQAGVETTLDTCVFHSPIVAKETKVLMTNSGKCAYYAPGELNVKVAFGDMADCVASAFRGRVCRERPSWSKH